MVFRIHMMPRRSMKFMFICFFFLLFMIRRSLCIGSDRILAGQSLSPNQTIISEEGRFELGFFAPGNSSNYYVGIWYTKIPVRTVVWVANRNSPISYSFYNDSRLEMSEYGNLQLIANLEIIWDIVGTSNATEAVILGTGNFVLRNASGIIIWQSFDHPTDTWLPGAKIGRHLFSDIEAKLISWKNPNDPAIGNYSLGMEPNGGSELFIKRSDSQKLWRSGVLQGGLFNFMPLHLGNSVKFAYISRDDSVYLVYNAFNESVFSRIVMDSLGIMRYLVWVERGQSWALFLTQPSDVCRTYAYCGRNAICDINASPACSCLTGFVPRTVHEGEVADFSGGCAREHPKCFGENDFSKVSNIILPANREALEIGGSNTCKYACADNCSCNAYAYSREGGCSLFMGDLLDLGRLPNDFGGTDLYVRMDVQRPGKGRINVHRLALVVPIAAVFLICIIYLCYFWRKRNRKESRVAHQNLLLLDLESRGPAKSSLNSVKNNPGDEKNNSNELPTFSFSSVATATNNFSNTNKLGEGGFGPVYKGELLNGQFVAVKRLSRRSGQGLEEFKNETELIAKLQHRNLVGILGCCIENDEKLLIYEYMPNKSLDFFLFDPTKNELLDWESRVCVIEGIAQGLLYLHHYSRLRIVHRDLKASNILLDAEMNPKISDFGMARIFGGSDSQANTKRIVGTYGYMSPEYAIEGVFSIKSDVFAFGVLMLEIISGKKNTSFYGSDHLSLLGYAWNLWTSNCGLELIDPMLEILSSSSFIPLRYIQIGLLCIQENPGDRPMMSDVVAMLNNEQKAVASPKHPAFTVGRTLARASPGENKAESVNELTVSLMEAR